MKIFNNVLLLLCETCEVAILFSSQRSLSGGHITPECITVQKSMFYSPSEVDERQWLNMKNKEHVISLQMCFGTLMHCKSSTCNTHKHTHTQTLLRHS